MSVFKYLFTPVEIGNTIIKNRILSTAHQTNHVLDGIPTDDLIAYHVTRARGGLGLIILEAGAVHSSGLLTTHTIAAFDPSIKEIYRKLIEKVSPYDTKVFAQLFHGGREIVSSNYRSAALAPSSIPSMRFGTMPRPMSLSEIQEVIAGFAKSARNAKDGGLHGVEVCCSHGYLPAQFWSEQTNKRNDKYGGSFENRMRFIVETIQAIWKEVGEDFTVGIRMSSDEMTIDGLTIKDSIKIAEYLTDKVRVDFINITAGDSSTYAGSTHIVPPAPMKQAYLAPDSFKIRLEAAVPVFVGSRIVDPFQGEKIISSGRADMVGMTRATIVDPNMPNKAKNGEHQMINACIGCLQACIGHYHKDLPIGCVQNPQVGNEVFFERVFQQNNPSRKVLIIGAGPGGLEAAITADTMGYDVTVVDQSDRIGGSLNLMLHAPQRKEMAAAMLDNFSRQLALTNIQLKLNTKLSPKEIKEFKADAIICAVGSRPYIPNVEGVMDERVILIDDLFKKNIFKEKEKAVVFDFKGDWAGLEAALYLAEKGCQVTLVTARLYIAEDVHQYLRNEYMKHLYEANIEMITHHDFGGISKDGIHMRNLFTHEKRFINADHVILAVGRIPNTELFETIKNMAPYVAQIGDCLAPRTIEEATWEGLTTVTQIEEQITNSLNLNI
ncbi:FAD-dependent oxidoreductase [Lysinibacillus xylanilyticus]|uniref:oxidoreductase n=1 Tax=Lysinibacillus xylanilyticus TaxID=582475 RepID=UPI002B249805|nr:FAD-dependent oxidoreductase [Lysinibacillus xylanilyticus]MEB2298849.1 FAD-dependent oxidoreductase [Lysinibacillus xylanilyticus]